MKSKLKSMTAFASAQGAFDAYSWSWELRSVNGKGLDHYLSQLVASDGHSKQERIEIAVRLVRNGLATQRKAHEITGVARDTIRTHLKNEAVLEV